MTFITFIFLISLIIGMYYINKAIKKGKTIYLLNAIVVSLLVIFILMTANKMFNGIVAINSHKDLYRDRAFFEVKNSSLYNYYNLDSDLFIYLPNTQQLKNNIPKCASKVSSEIGNYLAAYDKIYDYLVSTDNYTDAKKIGEISKAILDFNYNYYNNGYFREIYLADSNDPKFKKVSELIEDDWANIYGNKEPLQTILNTNFNIKEQEGLAKDTLAIYKQTSDNCFQAGYGDEFYSVFWSSFSPIFFNDKNTVFIMQKSIIALLDYASNNNIRINSKVVNDIHNILKDNNLLKTQLNVKSYVYVNVINKLNNLNKDFISFTMLNAFLYEKSEHQNDDFNVASDYLSKTNDELYRKILLYINIKNIIKQLKNKNIVENDLNELNNMCEELLNGFDTFMKTYLYKYSSLRNDYIYQLLNIKYFCDGSKGKANLNKESLNKYYI